MNADSKAPGLPSGPLPGSFQVTRGSIQHFVVINSEGNSSRNTGQSIQECPRQPTNAAERMSLLGVPGSLVAYDFTSAKGASIWAAESACAKRASGC